MLSQVFRGDFGVGYARMSTADPMDVSGGASKAVEHVETENRQRF